MVNPCTEAIQAAAWWADLLRDLMPGSNHDPRVASGDVRPGLTKQKVDSFEAALTVLIHQAAQADEAAFRQIGVAVTCFHMPDKTLLEACRLSGVSAVDIPRLSVSVSKKNSEVLAGSGLNNYYAVLNRAGITWHRAA